MLTRLKLRNFKSWRELDIAFAPLTLIFGRNSSGKSSILQFLLLMKQTRESGDRKEVARFKGPYVDLGGWERLVFFSDSLSRINWELEGSFTSIKSNVRQTEDFVVSRVFGPSPRCQGKLGFKDGELRNLDYKMWIGHRNNTMSIAYHEEKGPFFAPINDLAGGFVKKEIIENQFSILTDDTFRDISFFQYGMFSLINLMIYLKPLRAPPERRETWSRTRPSHVGVDGAQTGQLLFAHAAAAAREPDSAALLEDVARWLTKCEVAHDARVEELPRGSNLWQVSVQSAEGGPFVSIADVGVGVGQALPVVTQCLATEPGSILIFEQPELHLHPAAQSGLGDLLIDAATTRGKQLIVETHSEHLLLRIQRRIAEGALDPAQVALYYCEMVDGASRLTKLDLTDGGGIANWPKDFFGDAMGEVFAAEEARLKRMVQDAP